MTPTESLLKELEKDICEDKECRACRHLSAALQIIRAQREELERMAKVDVSLLSNELAAAWALRHWVFARDALSRCDEIAKGVSK